LSQRIKLSITKKVAFSLFTTLAVFAIVEMVLMAVGVAPVTSLEDPFVGFSKQLPLMESSIGPDGQELMSTAQNKVNWFNEQSFLRKKPENTFRIFCMGGSTTYGHPYWDSTSFSRWLREFLPISDPSQLFEVINAGGISYASYRVAGLMEELAHFEPDLFIVYSVHNEFLERRTYSGMFDQSEFSMHLRSSLSQTRTWAAMERLIGKVRGKPSASKDEKRNASTLPGEVDEILNHTIGPVDYHRDDAWQADVLNHYEFNLNRMVKIARSVGAKIIFLTPASNEKNCSPFKSEFASSVGDNHRQQVQFLLRQAAIEHEDDNPAKALEILEAALEIDSRYPEAHYRMGQVHFSQKRYGEAMKAFRVALNEDVCPLRAVDEISSAVRRVGEQQRVPVVDFESRLRALCIKQHGHSILGEEYFMDHVHPTVEVHQQMARWIHQDLQTHGIVQGKPLSDPSIDADISKVVARVHAEMDTFTYGVALRNLAKVLHWAGKFEEAEPRARDALTLISDDPESRFVLADCLRNTGRSQEAIAEYGRLFDSGYEFERAYHPFGDLLAKEGEYERAKAFLLLAQLREPNNASIYYTLGLVHLRLGEYAFAIEALNESDRLAPGFPSTWYNLGQAKFGNNEPEAAIELFEKALAKGYDPSTTHFALGMLYYELKDNAKAIQHFESALAIDPTFESAAMYLELAKKE
jgi:tetratricopeptide (TPR) repeat protein